MQLKTDVNETGQNKVQNKSRSNTKQQMYLSQPKSPMQKTPTAYPNKQNLLPSSKQPHLPSTKFTVYPPKTHRLSSTNSAAHLDQPSFATSLSKDFKPNREFSHTKIQPYLPKSTHVSFNATYDLSRVNNDFNLHRYSCNIDTDRNSDHTKSPNNFVPSFQIQQTNLELQTRVKQLEERIKKNEESLKFYCEQIELFKHQFSSTSLLDSINTNVLTVSTREPLKELSSNTLTLNSLNKENHLHNIDFLTNSPKDSETQKKLKQIDQVKKDVKKLMSREDTIKGEMKLFQASVKEILSGFREYLSQSVDALSKMQEKNKKKIFDKLGEEIEKRLRDLMDSQVEPLKKMMERMKTSVLKEEQVAISRSREKFTKQPILLKVREEGFCLIKKAAKVSPFESYQEMIKRNIYEAMGRSSTYPIQPRMSQELYLPEPLNYEKVTFDQSQITYYIDQEGYLLDKDGFYLVMGNERIMLDEVQIDKLKKNRLLASVQHFM